MHGRIYSTDGQNRKQDLLSFWGRDGVGVRWGWGGGGG